MQQYFFPKNWQICEFFKNWQICEFFFSQKKLANMRVSLKTGKFASVFKNSQICEFSIRLISHTCGEKSTPSWGIFIVLNVKRV